MNSGRAVTPLAILGASYREVATTGRAELLRLARATSIFERLRESGAARAVASIVTCSRVEWILSAPNPRWAADLAAAGITAAGFPAGRFHARHGDAALRYLVDITLGLDSVCEGEPAVGRQVLAGLRKAHATQTTDRALRLVWKGLEGAIAERRAKLGAPLAQGIQFIVRDHLLAEFEPGARVVIWGQGEIGQAVKRTLLGTGRFEVRIFSRGACAGYQQAFEAAQAIVVSTGADRAYLELPPTVPPRLCIDVGCPAQVASAPGWRVVDLDALLAAPTISLDDGRRTMLAALAVRCAATIAQRLREEQTPITLARMNVVRHRFLRERLPELTAGLPNAHAATLRKEVNKLIHELTRAVRDDAP